MYIETHSFTGVCQIRISSDDQVSKQVNKAYGRCGAKGSYCNPRIGVSHGAYVSVSDTVSDVLHAKPCKFNVSGQPDYLLYSRGK